MYMLGSLSHDTKKCDTLVYTSFFQPPIRRKQLGNWPKTYAKRLHKLANRGGPVARSLVSANRWLRGIKMYRFPWYLTLVSTNHASRATRARMLVKRLVGETTVDRSPLPKLPLSSPFPWGYLVTSPPTKSPPTIVSNFDSWREIP